MEAIELKNFRNFEHLEKMPIDGITMLVGPNNSGKSTIIKACRLLGENLYKIMSGNDANKSLDLGIYRFLPFDFSNICGNFKRALSTNAKDKTIELTATIGFFEITIEVETDEVNSCFADIKSVKVFDTIDECTWHTTLAANKLEFETTFTYSGKFLANLTRLKEWRFIHSQYFKILAVKHPSSSSKLNSIVIEAAEEKHVTPDELRKKILADFSEKLDNFHKIEQQYESFKDVFSMNMYGTMEPFAMYRDRKVLLDGVHTEFIDGEFAENKNAPIITDYFHIKFDEDTEICNAFFKYLHNTLKASWEPNRIVYVPAVDAALNSSYFRIDETSNTDYATGIINRFYKHNLTKKKWIKDTLKIFGIGVDFNIEQVNSDFLLVTITKLNGEIYPLADLGRGAIQLFLKSLHIAMVCPNTDEYEFASTLGLDIKYPETEQDIFDKQYKKGLERYNMFSAQTGKSTGKKLIIIEEPEQNLHPALQSKLIDWFISIKNHGVDVLVETHSEYLIRRSQVLVAEAKYKSEQELTEKCPFKVYYLPETGKGMPYEMQYSTHGNFTRPFGDGFYDEADNLAMRLML